MVIIRTNKERKKNILWSGVRKKGERKTCLYSMERRSSTQTYVTLCRLDGATRSLLWHEQTSERMSEERKLMVTDKPNLESRSIHLKTVVEFFFSRPSSTHFLPCLKYLWMLPIVAANTHSSSHFNTINVLEWPRVIIFNIYLVLIWIIFMHTYRQIGLNMLKIGKR